MTTVPTRGPQSTALETAVLLRRLGTHITRFADVVDAPAVSPGSWVAWTRQPQADHNMALVSGPQAVADLAIALAALGPRCGLVLVPDGQASELPCALAAAGLTHAGSAPVMLCQLRRTTPLDAAVARATDADGLADVSALIEDAFALDTAGLRDDLDQRDDVIAWTARADHRPVSAVITTPDPDVVGVYCMATDPVHARQGHGRRILSHALAHHAAEGIPAAYLVATPAGAPLYRRLGFQTVADLDIWTAGPSTQFG